MAKPQELHGSLKTLCELLASPALLAALARQMVTHDGKRLGLKNARNTVAWNVNYRNRVRGLA